MTSNPPPPTEPTDGPDQPATPYPAYASYPRADDTMATFSEAEDQPGAQVDQPTSIRTAVRLMWAGAALSVVSLLVGLLSLGSIKNNIRDSLDDNGSYTQSDLDTAYHVAVVTLIVVGIVGIAVWLWMARANGEGRRAARIIASVLGGLNILSFLLMLAQGQATSIEVLFQAVSVVLAISILFLLWRRESTDFYNARSHRRLS